jgi:hypothetical protein
MKFSTALGALSGYSSHEIFPMLVSNTATGCSHLGEAGFAVDDCWDDFAAVFVPAAFEVDVFGFVCAGVVVEVWANAKPDITNAAMRVLISRPSS